MATITGRTSYPAPRGEMFTRREPVPIGDAGAMMRTLAHTALDLALNAGADVAIVADIRRMVERVGNSDDDRRVVRTEQGDENEGHR